MDDIAPRRHREKADERWFSTAGEFVRFLTPSNGLLAIVLTLAAYIATREDAQWWWIALLLLAAFTASLLVNWAREKFFGPPERRLAGQLTQEVAPELAKSVTKALGQGLRAVHSGMEAVTGVLNSTAHGEPAKRLGFVGIAAPLAEDSNSLKRCLEHTTNIHQLWVMGLQANKWIHYGSPDKEPSSQLRKLLETGLRPGTTVQFLLLDPEGETIGRLTGSEGEPVAHPDAVRALEELAASHPKQLEVRYYDELPRFRMVFCDGTLIVSCYALTTEGRFRTRKGSDVPHLVIRELSEDNSWPLFAAFADYYNDVWERCPVRARMDGGSTR